MAAVAAAARLLGSAAIWIRRQVPFIVIDEWLRRSATKVFRVKDTKNHPPETDGRF
jgi:hypothetical protein